MHCSPNSDLVPPVANASRREAVRDFSSRCIARALPPGGLADNAPEADLIEDVACRVRLCLGSSGYGAAALPNAATMRPRTGLSTDDNVKKETRVNIVVRDAKRSACQGQRPLWDIGCCSA